jgi:hypothetical protein
MNRDIEIHIDELVLNGFAREDFEGIKKAVESELARLIKDQGLPGSLSSPKRFHRLDAGEFIMPKGTKAGAVGNGIAGSVYNGFKNQKSIFKK